MSESYLDTQYYIKYFKSRIEVTPDFFLILLILVRNIVVLLKYFCINWQWRSQGVGPDALKTTNLVKFSPPYQFGEFSAIR